MPRSIRARLAVTFSLSLALLMIVAVTGLIWYSQRSAERNADNLLAAAAQRTAAESQDRVSAAELIDEEREDLRGTDLALSIVDRNGHIIGSTQKNVQSLPSASNRDWRVITVKLRKGYTMIVGVPWAKTGEALRHHAIALISLGAFVVIIASAGAWLLVGRALKPIPLLVRQAKASSADNLAVSLEPPSQDREMIELVDTLNGLLRRVTETAAAKGRFYSAASHELRTPLQALSGHLELALSRDRTKEEYKAAAEEAYAQAKRLVSLIRALLFLYQLDSSTALPPREPVDLVDVCKRSLSHFQPVIQERDLHVDTQTPEEMEILTPPSHIDMLVRNLVENAVRYADSHGRIDLKIRADSSALYLEISNDCLMPPTWRPEELFEPFSRPDSSRSSRTGGTGLGLAICKAIADANGWSIDLISEAHEVRAMLTIPRSTGTA